MTAASLQARLGRGAYSIFLGLCTAYAVWMGPETCEDDIATDQAETESTAERARTQVA